MVNNVIVFCMVVMLVGCGSFGSDRVEGDRVVVVVETGADATGGYPFVGNATGVIGACRVETTESPVEGALMVRYRGKQCDVSYDRTEILQ